MSFASKPRSPDRVEVRCSGGDDVANGSSLVQHRQVRREAHCLAQDAAQGLPTITASGCDRGDLRKGIESRTDARNSPHPQWEIRNGRPASINHQAFHASRRPLIRRPTHHIDPLAAAAAAVLAAPRRNRLHSCSGQKVFHVQGVVVPREPMSHLIRPSSTPLRHATCRKGK